MSLRELACCLVGKNCTVKPDLKYRGVDFCTSYVIGPMCHALLCNFSVDIESVFYFLYDILSLSFIVCVCVLGMKQNIKFVYLKMYKI